MRETRAALAPMAQAGAGVGCEERSMAKKFKFRL
jgi:hypothetical protein